MPNLSTGQHSEVKKKLLLQIVAAQKKADAAKKTAKLAKLTYRQAKQKLKDAKRLAKKLRKAVKALKSELASVAVKKAKPQPAKGKAPRRRPVTAATPVASVEAAPAPTDTPPALTQ